MDRKIFDKKRMFGFKVGRRWVSTCGDFERELTVPGGALVPTAAVTVVTVHPPYRRRGLLTAMMTHQLEQVAKRGEPLAALWASESLIYGRYGYGPAEQPRDPQRDQPPPRLPPRGADVGLGRRGHPRGVPRRRARPARVDAPRATRHDSSATTDVWEFAIFDMEFARRGASEVRHVLHYDDVGDVDGFATYRFKDKVGDVEPEGEVRIKEVWAEEPTAYASLWRYLLDLDLARSFRLWSAPLDEPLRHLVTDARSVETSDHRQPLRPRRRRRGRPACPEVRRRRRPRHRDRRPDSCPRTPVATGSSPTATPRARPPRSPACRHRSPTSRWASSSSGRSTSVGWP